MTKLKRRNYSNEYKEGAVKLVVEEGYSVAEVARNLGVNANLFSRWKRQAEQPDNESLSPGGQVVKQTELKRLKKKISSSRRSVRF